MMTEPVTAFTAQQLATRYASRGMTPRLARRLLASAAGYSLLELELGTGRMHQIRVHLAGIGHPILGDDKYGDRAWNREQHAKRLMLTATELTFSLEGPLDYLNSRRFTVQPGF